MTPDGPARISVVMGKGGVGRTTVASALALDRARAGERVLLSSLVDTQEVEQRLRDESSKPIEGGELRYLRIDPQELVDALVRRVTRLGVLSTFLTRHPSYESLMDIVPGMRDLAVLHRIVHLATDGDDDGTRFDRVILDGAATGHGIDILEAPRKSRAMVAGPLRERTHVMEAILTDPETTEVVVVTLPEEMPVQETIHLVERLRAGGFHVDDVVVNRWLPRVFADEGPARLLARLETEEDTRATLQTALEPVAGLEVDAWLDALLHVRDERAEALQHLRSLETLGAKLALVPVVPEHRGRLGVVADALRSRVDASEVLAGEGVPP